MDYLLEVYEIQESLESILFESVYKIRNDGNQKYAFKLLECIGSDAFGLGIV